MLKEQLKIKCCNNEKDGRIGSNDKTKAKTTTPIKQDLSAMHFATTTTTTSTKNDALILSTFRVITQIGFTLNNL